MFKEIKGIVSADEYPLYKEVDSIEPIPVPEGEKPKSLDKHRALYKITPDSESKTHYYLTPVGRSYRLTKGKTEYHSFDYGYMSNANHGNEYKKDKVVTISQFPATNQPIQELASTLSEEKASVFYHQYTQSPITSQLISRYGVKGNAIKSIIKDPVIGTDAWLLEDETNSLTTQYTPFHRDNPCVIAMMNRNFANLDQFHSLVDDKVYRFPLN